jgi:hypothetical protein
LIGFPLFSKLFHSANSSQDVTVGDVAIGDYPHKEFEEDTSEAGDVKTTIGDSVGSIRRAILAVAVPVPIPRIYSLRLAEIAHHISATLPSFPDIFWVDVIVESYLVHTR